MFHQVSSAPPGLSHLPDFVMLPVSWKGRGSSAAVIQTGNHVRTQFHLQLQQKRGLSVRSSVFQRLLSTSRTSRWSCDPHSVLIKPAVHVSQLSSVEMFLHTEAQMFAQRSTSPL